MMLVKEKEKDYMDKLKEAQLKKNERKKLNFSSHPENLALVEKLIDEICESYNIKADFYGNILISITEAVNNAIQHGNKYDPKKCVEIAFESHQDVLYFSIEDQGPGFDYKNLPDPTDPDNIEKINGRGIFLMKNLADEVTFSKKGRIVELNFKAFAN